MLEKKLNIIKKTIENWKELKGIIDRDFTTRNMRDYWIFRGQSNHKWPLSTTLERLGLENYESDIIQKFERHAHLYSNTQQVDTLIEWMSLMQHHGAPTRLLDWTRSPYVAIFFALNDVEIPDISKEKNRQEEEEKQEEENKQDEEKKEEKKYCVFYAINTYFVCKSLSQNEKSNFLFKGDFKPDTIVPNPDHGDKFKKILFSKPTEREDVLPEIIPLIPFNSHARLNIQQGLFLCPLHTVPSFEDSLVATLKNSTPKQFIRKYLIPIELKPQIITELNHMNINDATLFPGIEGYSRFLRKEYHLKRERVLVDAIESKQIKIKQENYE